MKRKISDYKTLIFDCDGVILNSNKIKTEAFFSVTEKYGIEYANQFIEYHIANGGISRFSKFKYFLNSIVKKSFDDFELNHLIENFAFQVKNSLIKCDVAEGIEQLKKNCKNSNWLVVSGSDQIELREVFRFKGLDDFFESGIFGSPDNKKQILKRELQNKNISLPALFIGDSKYDFLSAKSLGIDFVFLYHWTDVLDYKSWVDTFDISARKNIKSLI